MATNTTKLYRYSGIFLLALVLNTSLGFCQDSASAKTQQLPSKYLSSISSKATDLEKKLDKKSKKTLQVYSRLETKISRRLQRKDSLLAAKVFANADEKYKQLEEKLKKSSKLSRYIPHLDTITTSLKFLEQNQNLLGDIKEEKEKLSKAITKVKELENSFQKAEEIKKFLKERKQYLKEQLSNLGFANDIKKLNKQVYYYSAQLTEYEAILKDPRKAEQKAIELLSKTKLFRDFIRKNSMLASLFRIPRNGPADPTYLASLAGLQTRVQVNGLIQQQIATGGPNAMQQFRQNMQDARSQLNELKKKMTQLGGSSSDDIMPEGFKPNNEKKKSFLKRLEYGANVQTQKANSYFPITSDIGLSVGYKVNNRSLIGIGASYKLGLGRGWDHISLSNQGVGLRSFVDWKLKGGLFISGGYEQNYKTAFRDFNQLKNRNAWQQSGLLGLSKTSTGKLKFLKKVKVQLLWDFLSYQQRPHTPSIIFRTGYNF